MIYEDKTLLELAAKAYGAKPHIVHIGEWYDDNPPERLFWNPLRDDGDALRLAVKLRLDIDHYQSSVIVSDNFIGTGRIPNGGDPYAATRRAIVRAAAEIGKALK